MQDPEYTLALCTAPIASERHLPHTLNIVPEGIYLQCILGPFIKCFQSCWPATFLNLKIFLNFIFAYDQAQAYRNDLEFRM